MPNYVTNVLTILGQPPEVEKFKAHVAGETGLDFETLIPSDGMSFTQRRNAWGTKWNAIQVSVGESRIKFETAWSTPYPIFVAMAKQFPDLGFHVLFADEDVSGDNYGAVFFQRDRVTEFEIEDGTRFSVALVHNQTLEEFEKEFEE